MKEYLTLVLASIYQVMCVVFGLYLYDLIFKKDKK